MSEWLAKMILTAETSKKRKKTTEWIIEIAEECLKLHNLNSVFYILAAINSMAIHRLKTLWDSKIGVSSYHLNKLNELKKLCSFERSSAEYRDFFTSVAPPKIPFFGSFFLLFLFF